MHTVASPEVAYLLLVIGLCLLVFEFFVAGVGVAGLVGAGCVVLGCYGTLALPNRPWAVALLILSILCFAIDVQSGRPSLLDRRGRRRLRRRPPGSCSRSSGWGG